MSLANGGLSYVFVFGIFKRVSVGSARSYVGIIAFQIISKKMMGVREPASMTFVVQCISIQVSRVTCT